MASIPENPNALLTRDSVATALSAAGFPVKAKTLATKATRGGGPPYQLFGIRPLYRWCEALAWAEGRLSAPRRSTSEGLDDARTVQANSDLSQLPRRDDRERSGPGPKTASQTEGR